MGNCPLYATLKELALQSVSRNTSMECLALHVHHSRENLIGARLNTIL